MNFLAIFLVLGMLVSLTGEASESTTPYGEQITDGRGRDEQLGDVHYQLYRHKVQLEVAQPSGGKLVRDGLRSTYEGTSPFARGSKKRVTTVYFNQVNPKLIDEVIQRIELRFSESGRVPYTHITNYSAIRSGRAWSIKTNYQMLRDFYDSRGRKQEDHRSVSVGSIVLGLPQLSDISPTSLEENRIELQALSLVQSVLGSQREEFSVSKIFRNGVLTDNSFRSYSIIDGKWQATEVSHLEIETRALAADSTSTVGINQYFSWQYDGVQAPGLYRSAENLFLDFPASLQSNCVMWDSVKRRTDLALQAAYLPGRLPSERLKPRLSACPY